MTRSILLILSAVLALFAALSLAKDDRLRMYAFASKDCNGPSLGGNIDVKPDQCMHIPGGALSIRPTAHKNQKWVREANSDHSHCEITTFTQYGCFQGNLDQSRDLPESISDCIVATDQPILSVSFKCNVKGHEPKTGEVISTVDTKSSTTDQVWIEPTPVEPIWNEPPITTTTVTWAPSQDVEVLFDPSAAAQTTVTMIVSSVDTMVTPIVTTITPIVTTITPIFTTRVTSVVTVMADTNPHPTVTVVSPPATPSMKTITLRDVTSPATAPSHMNATPINPEMDEETDDEIDQKTHQLVARGKGKWKGPRKGVWMLHPWTLGLECYDCYTKSSTDTHKFECRSGPSNPIDCGEMPVSPTITNIVEVTPTVTLGLNEAPKHALVKRKSWHRRVTFEHPWFPGTIMCADAEWEKRGQSKSEVRIQKPGESMKKCDKDDQLQDIGVHTTTVTTDVPPMTVYTQRPVYASTRTVYIQPFSTKMITIVGPPATTTFILLSSSTKTAAAGTDVASAVTLSPTTILVEYPHADL